MKIKKVSKLVKTDKILCLYNVPDQDGCVRQWCGTDRAVFPMDGLPYLSIEQLLAVLDIDEKAAEKIHIDDDADAWFDGDDIRAGEIESVTSGISVELPGIGTGILVGRGTEYEIANWGEICVTDRPDRMYLRKTGIGYEIIAARGMFVQGVFRPIEGFTEIMEREMTLMASVMNRR